MRPVASCRSAALTCLRCCPCECVVSSWRASTLTVSGTSASSPSTSSAQGRPPAQDKVTLASNKTEVQRELDLLEAKTAADGPAFGALKQHLPELKELTHFKDDSKK